MTAVAVARTHGQMLEREPLARYTSWRVGGPADRLYLPAGLADLSEFLAVLPPDEPLLFLGLGSNVLVRDGGIRGTVIVTTNGLSGLSQLPSGIVRAEAGITSAKLARFVAERGRQGAEFLAGIPGTVGGALAMNAGCFGSETWNFVVAVETIDRHGQIRHRDAADFATEYRKVSGHEGEWFVAGHFRFPESADAGSGDDSKAKIRSLLARRSDTQPTRLPNAGSVFKNPPGDFSARLIESAGLKGHRIGGASVSMLHANFIVNDQGATAADIEHLIQFVRDRVHQQSGVLLETEVRMLGVPL